MDNGTIHRSRGRRIQPTALQVAHLTLKKALDEAELALTEAQMRALERCTAAEFRIRRQDRGYGGRDFRVSKAGVRSRCS
jgi:hypothetical protein